MNQYAHYRTTIDGIPIHFLHQPGKAAAGIKPTALILTHGWPWTFWDYEKRIRPLADPARMAERIETGHSHMAVHSRDPQSLATALQDSPAGLAAWIVERRRAWSDCRGDLESVFSKDDLLTTLSLYSHTRTIGTTLRFYWENAQPFWRRAHDRKPPIGVPTGIAVFPEDLVIVPRKTAERGSHRVHWSVMEAGRHFAPTEQPEALLRDMWAWWARIGTL